MYIFEQVSDVTRVFLCENDLRKADLFTTGNVIGLVYTFDLFILPSICSIAFEQLLTLE